MLYSAVKVDFKNILGIGASEIKNLVSSALIPREGRPAFVADHA